MLLHVPLKVEPCGLGSQPRCVREGSAHGCFGLCKQTFQKTEWFCVLSDRARRRYAAFMYSLGARQENRVPMCGRSVSFQDGCSALACYGKGLQRVG